MEVSAYYLVEWRDTGKKMSIDRVEIQPTERIISMKKTAKTVLKRLFALALCLSLCMSLMTAVAMASEPGEEESSPNIELILPTNTGGDENPDGKQPNDPTYEAPGNDADVPTDGQKSGGESDVSAPAGEQPGGENNSLGENQDDKSQSDNGDNGEQVGVQEGGEQVEVTDSEMDEVSLAGQSDENASLLSDNEAEAQSTEAPEVDCSDKGQTSDGLDWEMTKDPVTGKYTLTIKFEHDSEDSELNITEEQLAKIEQYASEISAALAAKYGTDWEWDSTAAPSGDDAVQKFQVFLTGTGNKDHTYRYDSDKLEQMDGEFTIEKVDEYGNPITSSEATFQLWHINEITDPDTNETKEVKMFCSYDSETNTYTFIPTESTIQTINGRIEILYAMMKDAVYYLQEVAAPVGYEVDPSIHIVMEKDLWEQEDESFRDQFNYLGEFTEDENGRIGLDIKFTDVKAGAGDYTANAEPTPVTTPEDTPTQAPDPVPGEDPHDNNEPPVDDIPAPDVTPDFPQTPPVTETSVEVVPDPEPEAPAPVMTNDVPKTGDALNIYLMIAAISSLGLAAVTFMGRKKENSAN